MQSIVRRVSSLRCRRDRCLSSFHQQDHWQNPSLFHRYLHKRHRSQQLFHRTYSVKELSWCASSDSPNRTVASKSNVIKSNTASIENDTNLLEILRKVESGKLDAIAASNLLTSGSSSDADNHEVLTSFANLDHSRGTRAGWPEAVFGEGKTPMHIVKILDAMAHVSLQQQGDVSPILATRYECCCCALLDFRSLRTFFF